MATTAKLHVGESEVVTFAKPPEQHSDVGSTLLRLEVLSSSFTANSWSIHAKSPSLSAALLAKDFCVRTRVNFKMWQNNVPVTRTNYNNTSAGNGGLIFRKRPWGFLQGVQSASLVINSSAFNFSGQDLAQIMSGIWGYGDKSYQGEKCDKPPFNFSEAETIQAYSDFPERWIGQDVMSADFACMLPLGPFIQACWPKIQKQSKFGMISLPHCNDIELNFNMKPGWTRFLIQQCPSAANRDMGITASTATAPAFQAAGGTVVQTTGDFQNHTGITAAYNIHVERPRLCCVWSSLPVTPPPQFPVGFHRLTSYKEVEEIVAGSSRTSVSFQNIQLDTVPFCFVVCLREIDGFQDCNYFAPVDYSTVKVTTSVSSQPCGNYTGTRVSLQDQHRIYKEMSGNEKLSYQDWYRYRRALCFGARELGGSPGMFRNCYQPISLSVEFEFERDCEDMAEWGTLGDNTAYSSSYNCYLVTVGDSTCVFSEAGIRVSDVRLKVAAVMAALAGTKSEAEPKFLNDVEQD